MSIYIPKCAEPYFKKTFIINDGATDFPKKNFQEKTYI